MKIDLKSISLIVGIVGTLFLGLMFLATKDDVAKAMEYTKQVEQRLEQKITTDKIFDLRKLMAAMRDDHKDEGAVENWESEADRKMYRKMETELDLLIEQMIPEKGE